MLTAKQRQEIIFLAVIQWKHASALHFIGGYNIYINDEKFMDAILLLINNPSIYSTVCHQNIFEYEMEYEPISYDEIRLALNQPLRHLIE
ncbi:hypothetical protein L465_00770 [Enterobacter sp. BIDMC 29]|uniref:hypothetical protein n=1 Tax=Enterobacter sp. BIDMC 29 TaxID=1329841 RepID=UPI00044A0DF4|nr:hypothetical protein [Enterobacter sp. BIDMC 29]EUM14999.1 hypothetical protein L465_00770 [Enterobacter sp. BIDMC 29]